MTSIDKLSIRGIRSFSPVEPQIIEFHKPLTLIVGKNGSGKTTIIETLKMATTGDLPPNCRSGQAFINDPNALGTSEVKAQIKLLFTTVNKQQAMCARSFSLTQKSTRREYKAIESSLKLKDANGSRCLSYKVTELNRLIPEQMGVSQAVLENVIFAHQEEALWPLAEDKVLKQKFDDIFAATEYTRALDDVKKIKNDKARDIKLHAAELETLETRLNTANRLREDLSQNEHMLQELNNSIKNAQERTQEAKEKMGPLREKLEQRDNLRKDLASAINEHSHAQSTVESQMRNVEANFGGELEESDEEVRQLEVQQSSMMVTLTAELDSLKAAIGEMDGDISRAEAVRDEQRRGLEAERAQEQYQRKVEAEAEEFVRSVASEYELTQAVEAIPPSAPAAQKTQLALDALERVLVTRKAELAKAKEERQGVSQTLGAKVQQLTVQLEHSSDAAHAKEREAAAAVTRHRGLQEKLDALDGGAGSSGAGDEAVVTQLQQEVRDLRSQKSIVEEDLSSCGLQEEINDCRSRKRSMKDKIVQLNEELVRIEREGDKQKKLATQQAAADDKQAQLRSQVRDRRPKLAAVLDVPNDDEVVRLLDNDMLHKEVTRKRSQREEDLQAKEREVSATQEQLNRKSNSVMTKQERLKELDAEVERLELAIGAVDPLMGQESYDWEGRQVEVDEKEEEMKMAGGQAKAVEAFLRKGLDRCDKPDGDPHSKCIVCETRINDAMRTATKRKYDQIARAANQQAAGGAGAGSEELEAAVRAAKRHRRAKEQHDELLRLKNVEKPAVRRTLDELKNEQSELRSKLDGLQREARELKERVEKARDLMRDVDALRYIHKDLAQISSEVAATQSGMQSGMHTATRGRETVVDERDQAQAELDGLERKIEERSQELDRKRHELTESKGKLASKELELSKVKSELDKRKDYEAQIAENKQRIAQLNHEAKSHRDSEKPNRDKLRDLEAELRETEQRLDSQCKERDGRVTACMQHHTKLADYAKRLKQGSSAQRTKLMEDLEQRVKDAQKAVDDKRLLLKRRTEERETKRDLAAKQDKIKMQMHANLTLREARARERSLHGGMTNIQQQLHNVQDEAERAHREYEGAKATIQKQEIERAKFVGSKETVLNGIRTTKTQLGESQYKRIDAEHREKLIEHKCVQMVVEDLNRYYKALNAALMKFHETKMEAINKSIKELWNKTYKGSDIDGIAIKTEDEGQTADGRRKQSYRVVMKKGDSTLDMRGRCSAGQKVLASLVIRLALAETFCLHCGILTLDEPTTNLDRANIESLAMAINEIIKNRKGQSNFQLVVITHDEEFVQLIGRSENCSHYYWVEKKFLKDGDPAPASTITRKPIERFG